MRITDINIPEGAAQTAVRDAFGIVSRVSMPRLGKLVVFAGMNGAGKSRLLKLISEFFLVYKKQSSLDSLQRQLADAEQALADSESHVELFKSTLTKEPDRKDMQRALSSQEQQSATHLNRISVLQENIKQWNYFTTEPAERTAGPVYFVPRGADVKDPKQFSLGEVEKLALESGTLGHANSASTATSNLLFTLRRARNAHYVLMNGTGKEKEHAAVEDGIRLKRLVSSLLGESSNLGIDIDDQISLFGRKDFTSVLSDGQKILLKLAVQLHAQRTDLADALVFLDEPENHLHPAALAQVVDTLLGQVTSGQVWIATHSVPLIARLSAVDAGCIWYVEDGVVSHAGRKPQLVLKGLLGGEAEIACLREFSDLPAKLAANRYAAECLFEPKTVAPREGDKQQIQMVDALDQTAKDSVFRERRLRVLDFGAGQGRLLAALRDAGKLEDIEYIAFDIAAPSNDACKREIASVYGEGSANERFFTDLSKIISKWGTVDIAVMCNVLHEIPPDDWLSEIGPDSRLSELIADKGHLLVVEDQRIPVGENAHDFGFLVFDTLQFQKMFSFTGDADESAYKKFDADEGNGERAGRLLAHRFSKDVLSRYTPTRQRDAIVDLYKAAARELTQLRKQAQNSPPSFLDGQLHAFWLAQYANAALWLTARGALKFLED